MTDFLVQLTTSLVLLLPYFFIGFLFEAWAIVDKGNTAKNILLNVSHGMIYRALGILIGFEFSAKIVKLAHGVPFSGFINLGFYDHGRWWLAVPLAFLAQIIFDFFYYWFHRLQHASRWLWAEHELHHSEEHVNVTTGVRHHHIELLLIPVLIMFPMTLIFRLPAVSLVPALILRDLFVNFVHLNARISLGPMNRVFVSPQVHRIHHSKLSSHIDKNFAAFFSLWDVIFGTYYDPQTGEYPPTGLTSGRTVHSLWEAAAMPFVTWAKMLAPKSVQGENQVGIVDVVDSDRLSNVLTDRV